MPVSRSGWTWSERLTIPVGELEMVKRQRVDRSSAMRCVQDQLRVDSYLLAKVIPVLFNGLGRFYDRTILDIISLGLKIMENGRTMSNNRPSNSRLIGGAVNGGAPARWSALSARASPLAHMLTRE